MVLVGYTDKDDETDPEPNPNPQPTGEWTVTKWWHNAGVQGGHNSRRLADEKNLSNYWKVQNSWGTGWGDEGFIRIEITDGKGVCGINQVVEWVDMA